MIRKSKRHFNNKKVVRKIEKTRKSVFARFPLMFTLLGTFGLVATMTGVGRIIEETLFLSDNPIILVVFGLAILTFTGTLYKKLG